MTTFYVVRNNVATTTTGHTAGSGSLALATGAGASFGSPSAGSPIVVSTFLADGTPQGIYACTGRTGDTLTGLTLLWGTDANLPAGALVELRWTAEHVTQLTGAVAALETTAAGLGTASTHAATEFDAAGSAQEVSAALATHTADTANPHAVTAAQVGSYTTAQVDTLLTGKQAAGNYQPAGSYQPLDADLTAVAALSGTGFAVRTGANTWTTRAIQAADLGTGTASSSTYLRGDQTWTTPTAALAVGTAVTGGGASQVLFVNSAGNLATSANFRYDGSGFFLTSTVGYSINFIGMANVYCNYSNSAFSGLTVDNYSYSGINSYVLTLIGVGTSPTPLTRLRRTTSTNTIQDVAKVDALWATSTDASRKGRLTLSTSDASGTDREGLRVESDGIQPLVGFYGVPAVARAASPGTAAGTDAAVINAVITLLRNLGLCS